MRPWRSEEQIPTTEGMQSWSQILSWAAKQGHHYLQHWVCLPGCKYLQYAYNEAPCQQAKLVKLRPASLCFCSRGKPIGVRNRSTPLLRDMASWKGLPSATPGLLGERNHRLQTTLEYSPWSRLGQAFLSSYLGAISLPSIWSLESWKLPQSRTRHHRESCPFQPTHGKCTWIFWPGKGACTLTYALHCSFVCQALCIHIKEHEKGSSKYINTTVPKFLALYL